ncbi:putative aldo-keto reductase [Patellaria atrata CBS 101060]|uniref:Aldo-keto reductase n=1 Tax=Patellaria atrata CBS 101060 TaxID=1346257 RepID=A0A9P4SFN3_9PEZI|nr:putative aldo-keto reductase [Patellaria atrata CBS 101060]
MSPTLPTRRLGKNGPLVPAMGLGLMGLSAFYGPPKPDNERFALLDAAYDRGERFWDTADMYADSEDLLGRYFTAHPQKRAHIFLATKFGNKRAPDGTTSIDSSPTYCVTALANSLKRLNLPAVDLYYVHRLDARTPVEHTMRTMARLRDEGKFKYIGLSECSAASLRRASKVVHVDAVQVEYSPFALDIETEQTGLLAAARDLGTAIVAYAPLGRGMLTGALRSPDEFAPDDFRAFAPRFSRENFPKNAVLAEKIADVARRKGVSPAQLVLAWVMKQGEDVIPIPGTTDVGRLEENLGALWVEVTEGEEEEIRRACEEVSVVGERYPKQFLDALFADTPEEEEMKKKKEEGE